MQKLRIGSQQPLSRRKLLSIGAMGAITGLSSKAPGQEPLESKQRTAMGLVIYCQRIRRQNLLSSNSDYDLFAPNEFLNACGQLGAGGIQANLSGLSAEDADSLRAAATRTGSFIEAIIRLPAPDAPLDRLEHDVKIALRCGAKVGRTTIIPGRRYEQFRTYQEYLTAARRGQRMLERAVAVLEKHDFKLAVENHKDQRNSERIALLEHLSSEHVGACLDTGNSIALLEDPVNTAEAFAPWTFSVHLKDQSLYPIDQGFLLGDIALGKGCIDLKRVVDIVRAAQPKVHYSLELITRDPLVVPCFGKRYRQLFQPFPSADLKKIMDDVEGCQQAKPSRISQLTIEEQVQVEKENVSQSISYAGKVLKI